MPEIKITYKPCSCPKVTGAALRSVQAAERAQEDRVENLRRCAGRLSGFLNTPYMEVDATWIANALEAYAEYGKALKVCEAPDIPKRYLLALVHESSRQWPCDPRAYFDAPRCALEEAIAGYRRRLVSAGVPMDVSATHTLQYWRDAAARGC